MMLRERLWNRKFSLAKLSQEVHHSFPHRRRSEVRNFLHDYLEADVVFDPDAVGILIAAFDGALQSIKASRVRLSDEQIELVRGTLAKYIIEQARRGELDECRLRDGALLHLAQSNLRREPPQRSVCEDE
jgi:hypothetical protein